jgi:cardiolipin synthase A/B
MPANERIVIAPQERRAAVLDLIGSACRRLCLSVYRCDDRHVLDALGAACRRGVQVEALLTRRNGDRSSLTLLRMLLERLGVEVWRYGSANLKYHAKYVVADDRRALIGSLNFTRKCFKRTSDFLLLSADEELARSVSALFEADRDGLERPRSFSGRLIAGPSARRRILRLIESAQSRIQLVDPKLRDPAILQLLTDKVASGITVELLNGRRVGSLLSHGKLLIVDGRIAVVGSLALSGSEVHRRREVAVSVEDPDLVRRLQTFLGDRALPVVPESLTSALSCSNACHG